MKKTFLMMFISLAAHADIVGGDAVPEASPIARSTVALYRQTSQGGELCTASLIAKNFAVTAAHCVSDGINGMEVIFGSDVESPDREAVRVVEAEVPRKWRERHLTDRDLGDIAVVRFEGKLPQGAEIAHLLPMREKLSKGESVVLAGYGISNARKHTGAGRLREATVTIANPAFGKTEILFDQAKGSGACHGDSGGPAFIEKNGQYYLLGVTNRGYPMTAPDDCRHQVVYTQINAYRKWIAEVMKEMKSK